MNEKTETGLAVIEKPQVIKGGRNLFVLGIIAMGLAIVSSAVSLSIYHATGDIYLDRSRPGFISEEEREKSENGGETEKSYVFPSDGAINQETLNNYLNELDEVLKDVKDTAGAFSADALSGEALGITETPTP